jgi:hypothetical protein
MMFSGVPNVQASTKDIPDDINDTDHYLVVENFEADWQRVHE